MQWQIFMAGCGTKIMRYKCAAIRWQRYIRS